MSNLLGECLGTCVMVVFACGGSATANLEKSYGKGGGWICITAGCGFSVLFGVLTAIALGAPQADINPSITLAKTMAGIYTWQQCFATSLAQLVGGILGGIIIYFAYLPHWKETRGSKLHVFCTNHSAGTRGAAFLTECIATFFLMFLIWCIFSLNLTSPMGFPPGFAPYLAGLLVWALGISLGGPTGFALNGARDLGPRIAYALCPIPEKGSCNWGYAWVPVLAPLCGAVIAYLVAAGTGLLG